MARRSRQNPAVREFILRNAKDNPTSLASATAKAFGLSRAAVNRYVNRLVDEGYLEASGNTRARRYSLKKIVDEVFTIEDITRLSSEDTVWRFRVLPLFKDVPQNVINICQYGFTEIFNNVIDHSLSDKAIISYTQTSNEINMAILDMGIGIFQRIQNDFEFPDARSALLELSKGKLTSDKDRHTGEGIFFTSAMFDRFSIQSGNLVYMKSKKDDGGWLIETGEIAAPLKGTTVHMAVSIDAGWTIREIFEQYQGEQLRFRKTHIPVKLANYPGEQLVSRSQAKRILARFDQFSGVTLDFEGVDDIGQPFADEIFRVFKNSHPEIEIHHVNGNDDVKRMIDYVSAPSAA